MRIFAKSLRFAAVFVGVVLLVPPAFLAGTAAVMGAPLALALAVRSFAYEPFSIPASSMLPTLAPNEKLYASKFAYGYSKYSFLFHSGPANGAFRVPPERGDVVIFAYPPEPEIDYVKRVVGLPGDRVQMKGGVFYLNGSAVPRRRLGDFAIESYADSPLTEYEETLPGGKTYAIIENFDDSRGDDTVEFLVPENHYFMLGDNRDNSADSRFEVGFVPEENIYAKAVLIFSSDRPFGAPKWIN